MDTRTADAGPASLFCRAPEGHPASRDRAIENDLEQGCHFSRGTGDLLYAETRDRKQK
jgi:hypothetical protein